MVASWKDQFRPTKIRPEHDKPMTFIISEWQADTDRPSLIYLFLRLAIFITFFVIWILTITMQTTAGRQRWAIYLTNWGLSLCLLQSCVSCILLLGAVVDDFMRGKYFWHEKVEKIYPLYWVLNIMATTVALTITLIYWTLIYTAEGALWSTMNFMVHGFNSILMLIDFWAVSHPVQLLHCVYPVLITLVYTIMTVIFYACGGTTPDGSRYIYPILKWDQPGVTIAYCLAIVVIMIIMHTLTYFMYRLRIKIAPPILSFIHRKLLRCGDDTIYA